MLSRVHSRSARESSWANSLRRLLRDCQRSPTERSEASGSKFCTRQPMATSEEAPSGLKSMTRIARHHPDLTCTTPLRKISHHWMSRTKRFKEAPQHHHLRHSQSSPTGSQLSTTQEVNHTINLQRVRTIVRKEANRTRPKAINQLQLLQTVDLTIVTDSSNSSNSWLNKINRYNSNRSQTITIAIVRVISEQ